MDKKWMRALIFFVVGSFCTVVLRTLQICFVSEPSTGFFKKSYELWGVVMTAVIFVTVAVAMFLTTEFKKIPAAVPKMTKGFAVCHILLAVAVFYEAFFSNRADNSVVWQIVLSGVLGLAGSVVLFLRGLRAFVNVPEIPPILNVATVGFWMVRIILVFSGYTAVPTIADNVFELACLCSVLLYFLQYCKISCDVEIERASKKLLPVSVFAFMMCLVGYVPTLVLTVFGMGDNIHSHTTTVITDIAASVFIFYYGIMWIKAALKTDEVKSEAYGDPS